MPNLKVYRVSFRLISLYQQNFGVSIILARVANLTRETAFPVTVSVTVIVEEKLQLWGPMRGGSGPAVEDVVRTTSSNTWPAHNAHGVLLVILYK